MRADLYAKGVNAAEEVLPGIKNDLLLGKFKPRETDVAAVARASPEERREKAEQLRVIPEKKPKADKESARSATKRQQEVYATIGKSYEDMKDSKRVTEDSALVSLRYTARNMVETCDVLFTNFPGLIRYLHKCLGCWHGNRMSASRYLLFLEALRMEYVRCCCSCRVSLFQ